jgi:hypothetical protein
MSSHSLRILAWLYFAAGTSLKRAGVPGASPLIRCASVALLSSNLQEGRGQ